MKDLKYCELFDIYGKELTKTQANIMHQYFNLDYSLAEIAQNENISRAAVQDCVKKCKARLDDLESKIGFLKYRKSMHNVD